MRAFISRISQVIFVFATIGILSLTGVVGQTTSNNGTITGRVMDRTGAVLRGATVRLYSDPQSKTPFAEITTNAEGEYSISVSAGTYTLSVSADRFQTTNQEIRLSTNQRLSQDIALPIEAISQSISVIGEGVYAATEATAGTKVAAPIMETPISVQVIPQQVIKDQQITRVVDALQNVSGVTPLNDGGGTADSFSIRGFDNLEVTYEDGLKLDQNTTAGFPRDMANIERVEIVKGSDSVLYGQSEPGGLVNFVTKKPLDSPYYSLEQQVGSFRSYRTTMDITGPLNHNGTLFYRFNVAYEKDGSFRDFIKTDRIFLFPTLEWKASSRTQFILELKTGNGSQTHDNGIPMFNRKPVAVPLNSNFVEPNANVGPTDEYAAKLVASREFSETWQWRSAYRSEHHNALQSNFQVYAGDPDVNGNLARLLLAEPAFQQWTHNVVTDLTGTFATFGLKHTIIVGFDYYHQNGHYVANIGSMPSINIYHPIYGQPITPLDPANNLTVHEFQNAYGAYLQDQIQLFKNLHLIAGFRWNHVTTSDDGYPAGAATVTDRPPLTPRVGLLWQAIPQMSLYGSYTSNYGSTELGILTKDGGHLPPQTAKQYEVGVKTEWFQRRLMATGSVYQITKLNVPTTDPSNPLFTIAVGEERSQGVELDVSGAITSNWRIIGGYSYIDARVTKDNGGLTGSRLPNVPYNSGSLFTTYEIPRGSLRGLRFGAGAIGRDPQVNLSADQIAGFAVANAMVSYDWHIGEAKLNSQINVSNLLNKDYFSSLGYGSAYPGAPRSVSVALRYEFK